jgi:hypothetical protein
LKQHDLWDSTQRIEELEAEVEKLREKMNLEQKALAILRALNEEIYKLSQGKFISIVKDNKILLSIEQDWEKNTITIYYSNGHIHVGQMDCEGEEGFLYLIDEVYKLFCGK